MRRRIESTLAIPRWVLYVEVDPLGRHWICFRDDGSFMRTFLHYPCPNLDMWVDIADADVP